MDTLTHDTLQTQLENGCLTVTLNRGRSNPINRQMIHELTSLFRRARTDDAVRGVIMNGKEGFFSAGLDLIELYHLNEAGVADFWRDFIGLMKELVSFPKPLVAAITGHCPAGGCVLALCADYRIMQEGEFRIGLNEIPVGIIVPKLIFELYAFWVGRGPAYQTLLEGKLMTPKEAMFIGLVDEFTPTGVLRRAENQMQTYLQFDANTWQTSKLNFRSALVEAFEADFDEVLAATLQQWWQPTTRQTLKHLVARLQKS